MSSTRQTAGRSEDVSANSVADADQSGQVALSVDSQVQDQQKNSQETRPSWSLKEVMNRYFSRFVADQSVVFLAENRRHGVKM